MSDPVVTAAPTAPASRWPGAWRRVLDVADPGDVRTRSIALIIWGAWTALLVVLLFTHEPWRDELQAWGLVRASDTPFDVILNLRHEGHPPTWYLVLWPVTLLTRSTIGVQLVAFVVGTSAAWITLRHMPVSLWLRAAVVFSYYPLYEMGTISRSYSLLWLLVVLTLWLTNRRGTPNWLIAGILAALAGTTVLAMPLAVALAVGVWGGPWFASRARGPLNIVWVGLFTVVPLAVAAVALPSGGGPTPDTSRLNPDTLWDSFASVLPVAYPVVEVEEAFWGRFLMREWTTWGPLLGAAIAVAVAWSVRRSRTALTVWVLSTLGFVVALALSGRGIQPRVVTPVFGAAIAAIWFAAGERLARPPAERRPVPVLTAFGVTFVAAASLWASAWAVWVDTAVPFSGAQAAAEWIASEAGDDDFVILCDIESALCSSVSIRLDVPAYTSATGEPIEYVKWTKGWYRTPGASEIPEVARSLAARTGKQVFIVAPARGYPLGCQNGLPPPPVVVTEYVVVCRADQLITAPSG